MSLVDLLGLFSLNHHDLKVKIPHPAVTQVVVDAQPTYCVEVELTMNPCGSHSVLGPLDLGAFSGPLCCIVCQSRCECTWASFSVGFGGSIPCAALSVIANVSALGHHSMLGSGVPFLVPR